MTDLRYALRSLRSEPRFTLAAVATLAIGIGITTTMFGVVDGVLLRPLPYPAADRLITICTDFPGSGGWCSISPPNVADIEQRSRTIEAIGIARSSSNYMKTAAGSIVVSAGIATPGVFNALGARAIRGRLITDSDLLGRESDVAVVSHEFWKQQLSGAPDVVGRVLVLDGKPVTVVGVLDSAFSIPRLSYVKLWRPVDFQPRDEKNRGWAGLVAFGRLRPGVTIETARAELSSISNELRHSYFATTAGWDLTMQPLEDLVVGSARPILLAFLASVFLVLLIACFNVANLIFARSTSRARQLAVRAALGAGHGQLVRAQLVESLMLAIGAAAIGVGLALWGTTAFAKFAPPNIPRVDNVHVDSRVLGFALLLAVATTVVFGLAPALRAARVDISTILREGSRSATFQGSSLRGTMLVVELALTVVLLAGASALLRGFVATAAWNPGFERDHLLTFSLSANSEKYQTGQAVSQLWSQVETELRAIPGVTMVGSTSAGPLFGGGDGFAEVSLNGRTTPAGAAAAWFNVSPGYFATLGVPILRGRDLQEGDTLGGTRATLVNETFVRRYLGGANPVGLTFSVKLSRSSRAAQIVGVVRDIPAITPGEATAPQMYWSNRATPRGFTYLVIRASIPPGSLMPPIRSRLAGVDADLAPGNIRTMPELVAERLKVPRFDMLVLIAFALAAVGLSSVGTYGLFAYVVAQRRRELGIRLALGAQPGEIVRDVLGRGLRIAAIGVVVGAVAITAVARVLNSSTAGLPRVDAASVIIGAVILVGAALAACWVPARRAGAVSPMVTLNAE